MIFGRTAELEMLDAIAVGLEHGHGRALAVTGESGVGKSTLLDEFAHRTRGRGLRLVHLRCAESESELPLSGWSDLVSHLATLVDAVPEPQAKAIRSAMALGPPSPTDALSLSLATLSLLRVAAPLVLLMDDAQWLDPASSACFGFVARRVAAIGLAFIVTARDPIDQRAWFAALPNVRPERLDRNMAGHLLRTVVPEMGAATREAVLDAAGGLPLALTELPSLLSREELLGLAPLPTLLRPGDRLGALFERRLERFPPRTRTMLALAAASDPSELTLLGEAGDTFKCALSDFAPAEDDGLIRTVNGVVVFSHPLARSASYYSVPISVRRRIHGALSRFSTDDQHANHLAAAAIGPDAAVAEALTQVARRSAGRGAEAAASSMFEKASLFAVTSADRAILQTQAGLAALRSAQPHRAAGLMDGVDISLLPEPMQHGARRFHGLAMRACGRPDAAVALWSREALATEPCLPDTAAGFWTDAAHTLLLVGAVREALAKAERAWTLLAPNEHAEGRILTLAVLAACRVAEGRAEASRVALDEWSRLESTQPQKHSPLAFPIAVQAEAWLGDLASARERCEKQITVLREASTLAGLPMLLVAYADVLFRLGDWRASAQAITEAGMLASDIGNESVKTLAAMTAAKLTAAQGSSVELRRIVTEVLEPADRNTAGRVASAVNTGRVALAHDALAHAKPLQTIELLQVVSDDTEIAGRSLEPSVLAYHLDLIEALVMSGRHAESKAHYERFCELGRVSRNPWTRATAALGSLLVANDEDVDRTSADILRTVAETQLPLELARTHLVLGERLHRARRRVEARQHLRLALAGFESLGALAWADRTRTELGAAGAKHRKRLGATHELTERERDIASRIADGRSNREIAVELFLSTKTVEFHLSRIYAKLGVRGRVQLVQLMQDR